MTHSLITTLTKYSTPIAPFGEDQDLHRYAVVILSLSFEDIAVVAQKFDNLLRRFKDYPRDVYLNWK